MAKTSSVAKTKNTTDTTRLNKWNSWLAIIYAVQGAVILLLSVAKVFPVQTSYLTADPIASEIARHTVLGTATRHIGNINMVYLVAAVFFIAAIMHGLIATVYRQRYETDIKKKINRMRWADYALSISVMLVAIGVLVGITDFSTLVLIGMVEIIARLLSLLMELHNQGKAKVQWLAYISSCVASVTPWFIIAFYIYATNAFGGGGIPHFVYWLSGSVFILLAAAPITAYLHYKKIGKWTDYAYAEQTYMLLGLVVKTAFAWQIFMGVLRP